MIPPIDIGAGAHAQSRTRQSQTIEIDINGHHRVLGTDLRQCRAKLYGKCHTSNYSWYV